MQQAVAKFKAGRCSGRDAIVVALSRAVQDEYEYADSGRNRHGGRQGGDSRAADVVSFLKTPLASAEKACMRKVASQAQVSCATNVPDALLKEQCERFEAQIAATDADIARMRQALDSPVESVPPQSNQVVADLVARLSRSAGNENTFAAPYMLAIEASVDRVMQDLVATTTGIASCTRAASARIDERDRAACQVSHAFGEMEATHAPIDARSVLRSIR
jgi:hypothetical protein